MSSSCVTVKDCDQLTGREEHQIPNAFEPRLRDELDILDDNVKA